MNTTDLQKTGTPSPFSKLPRSKSRLLMLGALLVWHGKKCLLSLIVLSVLVSSLAASSCHPPQENLNKAAEEIAAGPKGREISRLAQTPPEIGIPAIARYFNDEDELVHAMATLALQKNYGKAGSRQYAEVLERGNDREVSGILSVIDLSRCVDVLPQVRQVVYDHPNLLIQIAAIVTLKVMRDTEGLKEIGLNHPTAKVRVIALRGLNTNAPATKK